MGFKKYFFNDAPWVCFFIFLVSNLLLSNSGVPLSIKLVVFIFGILAPLVFLARRPMEPNSWAGRDFLPSASTGVWFLLGLAAVFIRFYHLETLFSWPNTDEGLYGVLAIDQDQKWSWRFFYTFGQNPPLLVWVLSFFFRIFKSPFLALWLLPALASTLTIGFFYLALRAYFSKSIGFIGFCLMAFSLWPFYFGRWCHAGALIPPWECICLWLLAIFLKEADFSRKKKWAGLLGFAVGLGSLTFTPWPFAALALIAAFGASVLNDARKNRVLIFYFGIPFFAALIPFFIGVWREGYGEHIEAMAAWSGWFALTRQGLTIVSYGASLFWGTLEGDSIYTADSGGMLNPVWGAAFFLGAAQLYRERAKVWARWTALSFFICLLPGFFSMNVEMFRVIQVLPFLLGITALGLAVLLARIPIPWRGAAFFILAALSAGMDGTTVLRAHGLNPDSAAAARSGLPLGEIRAYKILKDTSVHFGNGLIFTEFSQSAFDQTPFVTSYGFNCAENPKLDPAKAQWAAVLTTVDYRDFLSPRFTGARWFWLDPDVPSGKTLLGLIPVNPDNRALLTRWTQAHHYFRELSRGIFNIQGDATCLAAENLIEQPPSILQGDRFLESCYWRRRAQFYYDHNYAVHYQDQLDALKQAVAEGYPTSDLDYQLGSLLLRKKEWRDSRAAFEAALRLNPGDPDVKSALNLLTFREKEVGDKK